MLPKFTQVVSEIYGPLLDFLDWTGVHGTVWPQRASQYQYLTFQERLEGMEVVVSTNQGLRPKVVLGVQGPDAKTAAQYAKRAQKASAR